MVCTLEFIGIVNVVVLFIVVSLSKGLIVTFTDSLLSIHIKSYVRPSHTFDGSVMIISSLTPLRK